MNTKRILKPILAVQYIKLALRQGVGFNATPVTTTDALVFRSPSVAGQWDTWTYVEETGRSIEDPVS